MNAIGTERYKLNSSTYSKLPLSFDDDDEEEEEDNRRSANNLSLLLPLSFSTLSSPKLDNDKLSLVEIVTSSTVSELRLLSVRSTIGESVVDFSTFIGGSIF